MIAFLSIIVCVIGLIVYLIGTNGKAAELGRLAFFAGLFAFLLQFGPQTVSLLR